ncbi:MATE family efflux transporter [uncultured Ruthenibacterium sp.]|uniref:MATE family efflux transporter n=1 Tax=uncultured Ruthenibacterium sp. TaxID=1905347 RepID=UPI00349EB638
MNALLSKIFCAQRVLKNTPPQGEIPDDETLLRRTFRVAWPSTLESFLVALVGMVDTIMVSRLGAYAIAAVGLTTQPKFICLAVFMSLNIAVSALVARRKGEGDREGANRVLAQSMVLTVMFAIVITAIAILFAEPILRLTGSNAETHESAAAYFRIISAGMIFNVMSMVINAAQRGAGNTKIAMRTNLVSNGVNIVFNYLLIEGHFGFPRLGVAGAAVATVIGTMVALAMSVLSVAHPEGFLYLQFQKKRFRLERSTLATIANIGSSSLAEQLFLRFGFLTYAMIVARLGTTAFAAHQVGMNVITISFAFGDGLSVASVALVGQSLGEKRGDLARIYLSFCQRVGLFCSLTLAVVYSVVSRDVFRLFSSEEEILVYGEMIMRMVALIVIMQVAQVISSGCLRGAGDTKYVAIVSLVSVACIRPLAGYVFTYPLGMGLFGAWIGLVLDQFMRLILTSIRVRSGKWLNIRI